MKKKIILNKGSDNFAIVFFHMLKWPQSFHVLPFFFFTPLTPLYTSKASLDYYRISVSCSGSEIAGLVAMLAV